MNNFVLDIPPRPRKKPKAKSKLSGWLSLIVSLGVVLAVALVLIMIPSGTSRNSPSTESTLSQSLPEIGKQNRRVSTPPDLLKENPRVPVERSLSQVVQDVEKGIVLIKTFNSHGEQVGLGSGFVVDSRGFVATNFHVIQACSSATATFSNGTEIPFLGIRAWDNEADLSILELKEMPTENVILRLTNEAKHPMAEEVIAIGHPQGLRFTTTTGIISAIHQTKDLPEKFQATIRAPAKQFWIQTTAPISSGNSGGPLLNRRGEVAGINTWVANGENLGFAIDARHVHEILKLIKRSPIEFAKLTGPEEILMVGAREFKDKYEWFQEQVAELTASDEREKIVESQHPGIDYLNKAWEVACLEPKGPATTKAVAIMVQVLALPDCPKKSVELLPFVSERLVKDYEHDNRFKDLVMTLSRSRLPGVADTLKEIGDKVESRENKVYLLLAMAMNKLMSPVASQVGDDSLQVDDLILKRNQTTIPEVTALLKKLIDEFSDVNRETEVVQYAKAMLPMVQHLSIGSPIQKISGSDLDQKAFSTDDYAGKVLILDFWVDWCPHCRKMYPLNRKMVKEYAGRPFAILGINGDKRTRLQDLVDDKSVTWRNFADGLHGPIAEAWHVDSFPTVYVVDHRGMIRHSGLQSNDLERAVTRLVNEAEESQRKEKNGAIAVTGDQSKDPKAPTMKNESAGSDSTEAIFKANDLRKFGTNLVLNDESKFNQMMGDIDKMKQKVLEASQTLYRAENDNRLKTQRLTQKKMQLVELNRLLANPTTVQENNRLVGLTNALRGEIDLAIKNEIVENNLKQARSYLNKVREGYVQQVLDMRTLQNSIQDRYRLLAVDPNVKRALEQISKAEDKLYVLGPSRTNSANEKKLTKLEEMVLSEDVAARLGDGNLLYVSAVFNGSETIELAIDTGASSIVLSWVMAEKLGLKPRADSPKTTFVMADGRQVEGSIVMAKSVRVGKFTVDNVECAVFGPENPNVEPLLGQSFLENFIYKIDSGRNIISITRVDGERAPPNSPKK